MCNDPNAPPAPYSGRLVAGISSTESNGNPSFRVHFTNPNSGMPTQISYEGLRPESCTADVPFELAIFTTSSQNSPQIMESVSLTRERSDCGMRMTFAVGDTLDCVVGRGVVVFAEGGERVIGSGVIGWA